MKKPDFSGPNVPTSQNLIEQLHREIGLTRKYDLRPDQIRHSSHNKVRYLAEFRDHLLHSWPHLRTAIADHLDQEWLHDVVKQSTSDSQAMLHVRGAYLSSIHEATTQLQEIPELTPSQNFNQTIERGYASPEFSSPLRGPIVDFWSAVRENLGTPVHASTSLMASIHRKAREDYGVTLQQEWFHELAGRGSVGLLKALADSQLSVFKILRSTLADSGNVYYKPEFLVLSHRDGKLEVDITQSLIDAVKKRQKEMDVDSPYTGCVAMPIISSFHRRIYETVCHLSLPSLRPSRFARLKAWISRKKTKA